NTEILLLQETLVRSKTDLDNSLFSSNFNIFAKTAKKINQLGRQSGGLAFVVKKNVKVISHRFINERIGILRLHRISIINVYLPYFDRTKEQQLEYELNIHLLEEVIDSEKKNHQEIILAGDFNTDLIRFDKNSFCLRKFLKKSKMNLLDLLFSQNIDYTYKKTGKSGNIKSWIDNVASTDENQLIKSNNIIEDISNKSDHNPILFIPNPKHLGIDENFKTKLPKKIENVRINWNKLEERLRYQERVKNQVKTLQSKVSSLLNADKLKAQLYITELLNELTSLLIDCTR
ncbi:unnamed protein product, partial [Brachionus calyciflorus]